MEPSIHPGNSDPIHLDTDQLVSFRSNGSISVCCPVLVENSFYDIIVSNSIIINKNVNIESTKRPKI